MWFLDPTLQTLEVYRLAGDAWQLADVHAGDASVTAEPFEAVSPSLAVARVLWQMRFSARPALRVALSPRVSPR